jgi:PKD repeat protein
MRKIYALLAGIIITLASIHSANARTVTPDVANFNITIDAPNNNVFFTNTSIIGSEPGYRRAYWNFGDGITQITGPLDNTQHHYQVAGTFNVCLRIYRYYTNTGDSVLTAYVCKTVVIQAACNAEFVTLSVASNQLLKYFVAQPSHNQNKKPVQICWQFGDARDTCINYSTTYTGAYGVSHIYAQPGNYNVCVSIHYDGGCQAYKCHLVEVIGNPDTCGADFERIPSSNTNPLLAYFKALPQHNNNRKPSQVCWHFGDGRDSCINYTETYTGLYTVSHLYAQPGQYQVCVNIRYFGGCEASKCKPIQVVRPDTCGADFERIASGGTNPLLAYYKALPQHNNNRKPSRVCWSFGDGLDSCINYTENYTGLYAISHQYLHPGLYQVCVHITYYGGCEATKCKPIQAGNPDSCGADFERIVSPNTNPLLAYFKALPQHNNNRAPSRICWTFGEGGRGDTCINYPENYTGQYVISHTYLNAGPYQVCVNIRYYGGCEADKCKPIQVGRPDTCGADFERLQPVPTSLSVYLKALPQHNNNKKPSRICWTFGEGGRGDTCINYTESFTGQYVIYHNYLHPGQYQVCVHITYFGGCEATKCKPIIVGVPDSCGADFERIASGGTNPLLAYYKALPQHNNNRKPSRICWTFGEGGRGDTCINYTDNYTGLYAISHQYLHPGLYQVCVHITYFGGCEATKCKPIQIGVPDSCAADFERIPPTANNPLRVYFRALPWHNNNKQPQRICWHFGDGLDTCITYPTAYTGQYVVVHNYQHSGIYQVCVNILYFGGCEATQCKPIQVGERPDTCGADFERIPNTSNPLRVYLRALPQHNNNKQPQRICWTFGEGGRGDTCINYPNPYSGQYVVVHEYLQPGSYNVCVNILYAGGCQSDKCKAVQVIRPDTCHADFEKLATPNSNPLLAYYKALPQHNNNRKPSRVCWTFGEGGRGDTCINYAETFTGQYVTSHTYLHPGLYQVCVRIEYYGGCQADKCKPIQIGVPDSCGADFERLQPVPTSLLVYLRALPQHNNNRKPSRICWTFGEGGRGDTCINYPENYTGQYVIYHNYLHPGQYQVCVQITYYGACVASKCKPIEVGSIPDLCTADFERLLTPGGNPYLVYYKAFPQHSNNRKPSRICWHFGDGRDTCINYPETFTGQYVVSHLYQTAGQYQVCVEITYYGGCVATKCKLVPIPGGNQPILVLSPNPVINILHVDFFSTRTEQINIKIFNSTGNPVRTYTQNVTIGANSWTHDLSNLMQGVYSYTVQSPTQLASAAFIKL